jgi:uncharacterized protein YebE (UPF0316 family)
LFYFFFKKSKEKKKKKKKTKKQKKEEKMGFITPENSYYVLPIIIFLARIVDVSLGTLRIIFVSRSKKITAAILGFFEVFIWIAVIGQIMKGEATLINNLSYALGFACGNFVGILIEEKLAMGSLIIRIITRKEANVLINTLRNHNFGVTYQEAYGKTGKVHLIYSVIKRKRVKEYINLVLKYNPKAFYSIEDVKHVNHGIFPTTKNSKDNYSTYANIRKGK